jgi:hypothetical protein
LIDHVKLQIILPNLTRQANVIGEFRFQGKPVTFRSCISRHRLHDFYTASSAASTAATMQNVNTRILNCQDGLVPLGSKV